MFSRHMLATMSGTFYAKYIDKCPKKYIAGLSSELKEIFNAPTLETARLLRDSVYDEYKDVAAESMAILDEGFEDSMTIMALPSKYRISLRTSNVIERENREIRRREQVIQIFPNSDSVIRLIGAVLLDHHNDWSLCQRVFDMKAYYDDFANIQIKLKSDVA